MFKKIIFLSLFTILLTNDKSEITLKAEKTNIFKATILDEKIPNTYDDAHAYMMEIKDQFIKN